MKNNISIGLKLLGLFFVLFACFSMATLFLNKTTGNLLLVVYSILYALISFITAVGIFKLKPWARVVAILFLVVKMLEIIIGSFKDINAILGTHGGVKAVPAAIGLTVAFVVIDVLLIFYLMRPSIRAQFGCDVPRNHT